MYGLISISIKMDPSINLSTWESEKDKKNKFYSTCTFNFWAFQLMIDFITSVLQVTGEPVGEVKAVSGMHERKAEMARYADAFIALPGTTIFS